MQKRIDKALVQELNRLAMMVYNDAQDHGLYDEYKSGPSTIDEVMGQLAVRIAFEAAEAYNARRNTRHFAEELADVVIMTLSAAAYLGIDIGEEIEHKRIINMDRPMKHWEEKIHG